MKSLSIDSEIDWEDANEVEHSIAYQATAYRDTGYNADADGNRGITHSWIEIEGIDYPPGLTDKVKKEIDQLIEEDAGLALPDQGE